MSSGIFVLRNYVRPLENVIGSVREDFKFVLMKFYFYFSSDLQRSEVLWKKMSGSYTIIL